MIILIAKDARHNCYADDIQVCIFYDISKFQILQRYLDLLKVGWMTMKTHWREGKLYVLLPLLPEIGEIFHSAFAHIKNKSKPEI